METVRLQSAVNSLLECAFCFEVYQDPRMLPCGHTFCLRCLQQQYETGQNKPKCGICRAQWTVSEQGVASLPKNFVAQNCITLFPSLNECGMANDGLEHGKVEYFCIDCWDPLCVSCKEVHRRTKLTRNHSVKNTTEISKEDVDEYKRQVASLCPHHKNQELTLFCTNCKEIGCATCIIKSHSKHDCTDLIEADKNFIEDINSSLDELRQAKEDANSRLDNIAKSIKALDIDHKKSINSLKDFIDDVKMRLRTLLDTAISELEQCQKSTMLAMNTKADEEKARLQNISQTITAKFQDLQEKISQCEKYLSPSSSVNERLQFIKKEKSVSETEPVKKQSLVETTSYCLVDFSQWKSDVTKWMEPIETVLAAANTVPHLQNMKCAVQSIGYV